MAKVKIRGIVANVGEYGPFEQGRTIPYVDVLEEGTGSVFRATLAEGVDPPMLYATGEADAEFYVKKEQLKCRLHGFAESRVTQKAAA